MPLLTKLNKIKNLAVYSDYKWDSALEPFKRFNLIFGWNGSGKTALSRLFGSLSSGKHELFPDLEFEVTIDGTQFTQADSISTPVRVFNREYIDRNIKILEGKTNPILVVGEKSQEALAQIQSDEHALNGVAGDRENPGMLSLRQERMREKQAFEESILNEFSSIAKTIGAATSTGAATRTYRRPEATTAFSSLTQNELLSKEDLDECRLMLKQSSEPTLTLLQVPKISIADANLKLDEALGRLLAQVDQALNTKVQIIAIERLSKNPDIAVWAEKGLVLHREHNLKSCEFCLQGLPSARLSALEEHFNDADKKLKVTIERLLADVENTRVAIGKIESFDEAKLYKSLRSDYVDGAARLNEAQTRLEADLSTLASHLNEKRVRTTEAMKAGVTLDPAPLEIAIRHMNEQLTRHNEMTTNLEENQTKARGRIERHYLSTIRDEIIAKRTQVTNLEKAILHLQNGDPSIEGDLGIEELQRRIAQNRAKVSSAHKSCEQLNEALRSYFGRNDLVYEVEVDAGGEAIGYSLRRGGKVAQLVSEGELTAIAFAHFTIRLFEQGFNVKEGIVVLDDPISSLDSAALYRVCASIQKHLTGAAQLFVLTHNMEFFNHMKKWYRNDPAIRGEGVQDEKDANYRLLMIQSAYEAKSQARVACIANLDPMLRDHETEYHFLFKKLDDFEVDNPPGQPLSLHAIYDYPNLTRKLLECFLAFRVPKRGNMYTRMFGLREVNKAIASEDISHVYNFINSNSHLDTKTGLLEFDATIAIAGPVAIKKAMKLIELADPEHFKAMRKAVRKL